MGNIQVSQGGGDPGPSTSQVNPTSTGPQTPKRARLGLERPELQPLQIDIKKVEWNLQYTGFEYAKHRNIIFF